jgi:hypothetical protein
MGPSSCYANCFDNYKVSLKLNKGAFPEGLYVISYYLREPNDWGGNLKILVNGKSIGEDPGKFAGQHKDSGWYKNSFTYSGPITSLVLEETDLTSAETVFLDDVVISYEPSPIQTTTSTPTQTSAPVATSTLTPAPTTKTSATSTPGTLNVVTGIDGGKIYVNGEYSGVTTYSSFGSTVNGLLPGTYTLKITISGYMDWTKQVDIASGKTTKVYAYPEPGTGTSTTRSETISSTSTFGTLNVVTESMAVKSMLMASIAAPLHTLPLAQQSMDYSPEPIP